MNEFSMFLLALMLLISLVTFKHGNKSEFFLHKFLFYFISGFSFIGFIVCCVFAISGLIYDNYKIFDLTFKDCLDTTTQIVSFLGSTSIASVTFYFKHIKNKEN